MFYLFRKHIYLFFSARVYVYVCCKTKDLSKNSKQRTVSQMRTYPQHIFLVLATTDCFFIFSNLPILSFQAQFILCIAHTIRALCTDCGFPAFVSGLLLLNASIFFVLFMNFYIQAYKNQRTLAKKID